MTSKIRRIRYKRRLILRPYIAVKRAKPLEKKTAQAAQAEITEPVSSAPLQPADTEEMTVAQLSNELASFKVEEDPYAYFVSQLPNILSAIPNLLQAPISQTEEDATEKASIRKNPDELQTAKKKNELDDRSAKKIAEKTVSILPAATAAASRTQQAGKTAHTYAYKMAEKTETTAQISSSAAKQDKKIAPESRTMATGKHNKKTNLQGFYSVQSSAKISVADQAATQAYTQRQITKNRQQHSDWSQQLTTVTLEEEKCFDLSRPEQIVPSGKPDSAKKVASMPIGIAWKVKADKNMQDWQPLSRASRRFLWPGLPEQSCQQIRFGGQKEGLRSAGVTDTAPAFLFSQLTALAEQRKCSLLWLLLLLSPVDRVRHFLAEQQLQDISRHCFNMPEIALQELTVRYYLKHLVASNLLQVNLACFAQVIPSLICTEKISLAANQLAVFFSRRLKDSENGLFKLTMNKQVSYIEMREEQVQIYNGIGKPNVWSRSSFLDHLTLSTFANNKDVSCEDFNPSADFRQQLACKLQQGELHWQAHWQRHLYEFIISPEAPIDATELS